MKSSLVRFNRLALGGIAFGFVLVGSAQAQIINPGFDHLQTLPGTFFDIGLGPIQMMGNPALPGGSDTVVRRLAPIDLSGLPGSLPPIPIEIVALELRSVAPISLSSSFFDVFVELSAPGTGQMQLSGGPTGGTFTSFFDVFVDINLVEVGNPGNTFTHQGHFQLSGGGNWHVDSFFDVFFEPFTMEGTGTGTWGSQTGFAHHNVTSVPEPFTMGLGAMAAVAGVRRIRRRRR